MKNIFKIIDSFLKLFNFFSEFERNILQSRDMGLLLLKPLSFF